MNYNPYAAPQASSPPPPPSGGFGPSQPWTAGEAVSVAWARFKEHWGVLVLANLIYGIIILACGQVSNVLLAAHVVEPQTPAYFGVVGVDTLVTQVVAAFFNAGMARVWLDTARGATPRFESMFSGADRFLPMLGLTLLVPLVLALGCVALVVPGIVLLAMYLVIYPLLPYYVVEGNLGAIDALRAAWKVSEGQRWELVTLSLLYGIGLTLLGFLTCCIGLLVTIPVYWVATAVAFTRIAGMSVATPPLIEGRGPSPPYGPGPHDLPPWR
ncbi:MAG: hypothetical protein ACRENE_22080 [Polyangiaceae bacterium]